MPIPVHCDCGKSMKVKDELAGRKIRCPECKIVVVVPRPQEVKLPEDEALNVLLTAEPPRPIKPPPPPANTEDEEQASYTAATPRPKPRPVEKKAKEPWKSSGARRASRRAEYQPWLVVNPSILSGLGMMGGAILWFVLGIVLLDTIFIYPPILFVLGSAAIFRGFTGGDE